MSKVFLNGSIIDSSEAKVSASDSGFLYGMGLFETMRAVGGRVFALDDHLDRFFLSSKALSINNPYDRQYITKAVADLLGANELSDARLRMTLTNGPISDTEPSTPTLLISAVKFEGYPDDYYKNGVRVILTGSRQNPAEPTCGHKTTSYAARLLALNEAHRKKNTEALWFTTDGRLAEGCVSNVFIVKNETVYTPLVTTPVLAGIARKQILRIAKENSIELIEKDLMIHDMLEAEEVFLTNVIMLLLPVVAVEAHTVADGKVGNISKKLLNLFRELVLKH